MTLQHNMLKWLNDEHERVSKEPINTSHGYVSDASQAYVAGYLAALVKVMKVIEQGENRAT